MSASISTHVLDAARGEPAPGVRVELHGPGGLVSAARTDADGRIAGLAGGLEPGTYRLVFHPPSPFFRRIELDLAVDEHRHYHVPLLVSPYSCVAYRGS